MIKIIAVGRIKEKAQVTLIEEYLKRLKAFHKIEVIELAKAKFQDKEIDNILEDEAKRILAKINPQDYVILLDLKGENISSEMLAKKIDTQLTKGKTLVFVIGGSHGVTHDVLGRSNYLWQLSKLTFPHQLVRTLLVEQIYRSFAIMNQHPYHK